MINEFVFRMSYVEGQKEKWGLITQSSGLRRKASFGLTEYETIQFSPHPTGAGLQNEAKIELKMQKKGEKEPKNAKKSQFCVGFWCFFVVNLKKQSQFAKGWNWRKVLYERWLWRFSRFGAAKKQSQFKANSVVLPPRTLSARRFLMCKNSRWCSWLGDFVSSAFSANSAVNRNLKKQNQNRPLAGNPKH